MSPPSGVVVLRRTGPAEIDSPPKERERTALVEHLVQVAALRALYARRAAVGARAAGDQLGRVAHPPLELLEPALGDADAAGVAVVDEDGGTAGLRVHVRREAADVPAVAHRPEREDRDQRVLCRVERAEEPRHLLDAGELMRLRQEPDR